MTNISEEMDRIAEETLEGANKQAELVNLTFTLISVELVHYEYKEEKRESYVGTVSLNGKEDDRYWLSGAILRRQIDYLVKEDAFPVRVKLIRDADRNGSPYVLKIASGLSKIEAPAAGGAMSDHQLIRAAIDRVGIDEVSVALGEHSDSIMVEEDGSYTLVTKGMSLTSAATIRTTLRELAG